MAKSNLLTAVFVKNIARAGIYNDGNGLLLVVSPAGSKSWIMRTRWKGKRREAALGAYSTCNEYVAVIKRFTH